MARIAVGGFQHETNTFSPVQGDVRRLRGGGCVARADAGRRRSSTRSPASTCPIAGFVREARGLRHELRAARSGARRSRRGTSRATRSSASARCWSRRSAARRRTRRDLSRPARRDGRGARRRRGWRAAASRPRSSVGPAAADRREPRLPRQRLAARWRSRRARWCRTAPIRMSTWPTPAREPRAACTICSAGRRPAHALRADRFPDAAHLAVDTGRADALTDGRGMALEARARSRWSG